MNESKLPLVFYLLASRAHAALAMSRPSCGHEYDEDRISGQLLRPEHILPLQPNVEVCFDFHLVLGKLSQCDNPSSMVIVECRLQKALLSSSLSGGDRTLRGFLERLEIAVDHDRLCFDRNLLHYALQRFSQAKLTTVCADPICR